MPDRAAANLSPQLLEFGRRVMEMSRFFAGKDEVHKTLFRLVGRLQRAGLSYAIVGGMAVNAHGYRRTTRDVDILLTAHPFDEFQGRFVGSKYRRTEGRSRRFVDAENDVEVDVLVTGLFPGSGRPGPVAYPNPADVSIDVPAPRVKTIRVIGLATLVELTLAARRYQDFADVVALIRVHNLGEAFLPNLNPSVTSDFIECLEEKRREDEYDA